MTWGTEAVETTTRGHAGLRGVDFDLEPGRISTVVGGDGAGKSTLARVMLGLIEPSAGRVSRPARSEIGYQPETSGVWPDLTVTENLFFMGGAHGLARPDIERRIDELLEITNLGSAKDRLAAQLSGGMRQKLGIAMAVLPTPRMMVLDEPTTGLDPVSRAEIWTMIGRAAGNGASVMVNTTYVDEAERGTRVLALEGGAMLAHGSIDDVRRSLTGTVVETSTKPDGGHSWRRGHRYRTWYRDEAPRDAHVVQPDLGDLLIIAALRQRIGATS